VNRTTLVIVLCALFGAGAGFWLGARVSPRASVVSPAVSGALSIGDLVPDHALPTMQGAQRRLSEWRGRPLLINFWATWCEPCIREMPMLALRAQRQGPGHPAILGIAQDDPRAVETFLKQVSVDYPILLDPSGGGLSASLGNRRSVLPFSVLLDADGRLLGQRAGSFDDESLDQWLGSLGLLTSR